MVFVCSRVLLVQFLFLYPLLSFTFTICFPLIRPKCHEYESHALLQFKDGFHIDKSASLYPLSYPKTASWNSTTDCCSWDGIQCDDHTNQVIQIDLSSSQLYGTMDANSSLFRLVHLRKLNLLDNDFNNSQIPSRIGELSQLEYLILVDTNFFGEIPPQISQLSKLLFLELGVSASASSTGMEVSQLNLKLSTLKSLIQNSTKLETLGFGLVTIASTLPDTLTNLTSLKHLVFYKCELHGEFPLGVFNLPNLNYLDLVYNPNLNGRFPEFQSSSLKEIILDYTGFNGTLPVSIGKLSSLNVLSIPGTIHPSICNLKSLVVLDFSLNNLSGNVPSCLGNFSQSLEYLMLNGNKLSGLIPQTLKIGNALQQIDLSNNNLQGQLPRELVNSIRLEYFDVSHNNICDSFPFWLGDLPELKVLALSNNQFHGDIRCSGNMTCTFPKLHIIDLSHNEFSGSFPSEIIQSWKAMKTSNTSQLQYDQNPKVVKINNQGMMFNRDMQYSFMMSNKGMLMVYENLQEFYSMIAIDISSNKISGVIPQVIGDLNGLILLNLSNNILNGSIPSSLGKLSNLEALDLSFNHLSGKLPQQLAQLTFLEFFNVSFNNLSGPIPQNKQFATFQDNSFEGNQGLCGDQLLKKCIDHRGPSFSPPSDGDNDSESLVELYWIVILIGYVGGLVAGLALGSTFYPDVVGCLKRFF
ncbi:hypothetical protein TSUD_166850 [Trifolium subterraneum]|uniref:Leucine-rich repeat-containing N-terminal plant-type domain-containing protein n=1 Tax=Trifolium subterraneum TaxID=3900 RepID=A0A2Z6M7C9_TRISU|nr:hypothetical protein TSUD_166850 [Trifolium subterraneum]